jgi:hypothetical protein
MTFDHKKHSLGQVENFLYDAMSSGATPQEIYDVIKGVVEDNYYTYKKSAAEAYELLALLNGNGVGHITGCKENRQYTDEELDAMCDKAEAEEKVRMLTRQESIEAGWSLSDEGIWMSPQKEDKVVKWRLPIEEVKDSDTDETEYFITFPDDLLEAANLKHGDDVEWVDMNDGCFLLRKTTQPKTYDEMIAAGYTMTADGFWIKE